MFPLNLTIDDSSPLIVYEPPRDAWFQKDPHTESTAPNYVDQTLTVTYSLNATASFFFNGTSLTVTGGRRPGYGNFTVTIDGFNTFQLTADAEAELYRETIFEIHNLTQGPHNVRLTNTDTQGRGFDIDSITWRSNVPSDVNETETTDTPPIMVFQDTQKGAITYLPKGSWNSQPERVLEFTQGTGHSTSRLGASINFTFTGQVVCLFGSTGPSNTRAYTVQIDSGPIRTFSARRPVQRQKQMLFHTDGLASGPHTVVMKNGNENDDRFGVSRQADDVDLLEFDYATVWSTEALSSQASSSSSQPSATTAVERPKNRASGLNSGAIAGITLACILFVGLLGALWALNRRNKTLWMRLQTGYMVQSQFDSQSTTSVPSGNPEMASLTSVPHLPDRNNNSNHIPCSSSEAVRRRESASTRIEQSYPFAGFGRDRSSSKCCSTEPSDSSTSLSRENPYPDSAYPVRNPENDGIARDEHGVPARSTTLDTVSTLVAEAGSQATSGDNRSSLKIFTRSPLMGPRPRRERTPPTPPPTLASSSSGSYSTRRRTSTRRFRLRSPRSSSPSETRLLPDQDHDHDQVASGSDREIGEDDEANYYASEALFFDDQPGSPSTAITQSSTRGRYSSLLSTVLGIPSRVDEESDRDLAEAAQLQARYLQRTRSLREAGYTGESVDWYHQNHLDAGNEETSTLVEVPTWMGRPTMESPPPVYTSNRTSLADRHREGAETPPRL